MKNHARFCFFLLLYYIYVFVCLFINCVHVAFMCVASEHVCVSGACVPVWRSVETFCLSCFLILCLIPLRHCLTAPKTNPLP